MFGPNGYNSIEDRLGRERNKEMSTCGGYLKDIPKPHKRKWPGHAERRRINITVGSFGIVGGIHYYVTLREEDNPIWDSTPDRYSKGEPSGWTSAWDDDKANGRIFERKCKSLHEVARFTDLVLALNFSKDKYEITTSGGRPYLGFLETYGLKNQGYFVEGD